MNFEISQYVVNIDQGNLTQNINSIILINEDINSLDKSELIPSMKIL